MSCGSYDNSLKEILHRCKFDGLQEAIEPLASILASGLRPHISDQYVVTHIPTAPQHIRHRGFDHMAEMSRLVAKQLSLPHSTTLFRLRSNRQIGASRKQRIAQAGDQFGVLSDVAGLQLVVLDDVMTTGATMAAALTLLQQHGAANLFGATVAYDE